MAGSGSTLRACAELNRNCYGFEIKKNFYKEAKEKMLSNIKVQATIFDEEYIKKDGIEIRKENI